MQKLRTAYSIAGYGSKLFDYCYFAVVVALSFFGLKEPSTNLTVHLLMPPKLAFITALFAPTVTEDQSASEMFQKLSRNLFSGRHCFIVRGITPVAIDLCYENYLHSMRVTIGQVERFHFVVSAD